MGRTSGICAEYTARKSEICVEEKEGRDNSSMGRTSGICGEYTARKSEIYNLFWKLLFGILIFKYFLSN